MSQTVFFAKKEKKKRANLISKAKFMGKIVNQKIKRDLIKKKKKD